MRNKRFFYVVLGIIILCMSFLAGCGEEKGADTSSSTDPTEEVVEEKDYLSVETSIAYSDGNTSDWSYGNQRKEFPNNTTCYVRIASTAITTSPIGRGKGDEITVTYRFTGTENCLVEISDGRASKIDSNDPNVEEFTRTISVAKEKKAKEDILIFRYLPNGAESVALEVIYDDQVADKFDALNTVYFDKASNSQQSIH